MIKSKLLLVGAVLSLTLGVIGGLAYTAPASLVRAAPPDCSGSADSMERCMEAYIADEIERRCGNMSADAAERCAQQTRQSIGQRDYDYDGVPDGGDQPGNSEADCNVPAGQELNKDNCGIVNYIVIFTQFLAAIVGIVVVIMIVVGGIQYTTARDNPQAVVSARNRIMNAVIALVLYMFSFALLQWLVPGGIIN